MTTETPVGLDQIGAWLFAHQVDLAWLACGVVVLLAAASVRTRPAQGLGLLIGLLIGWIAFRVLVISQILGQVPALLTSVVGALLFCWFVGMVIDDFDGNQPPQERHDEAALR